jgi:hypothetical protein
MIANKMQRLLAIVPKTLNSTNLKKVVKNQLLTNYYFDLLDAPFRSFSGTVVRMDAYRGSR